MPTGSLDGLPEIYASSALVNWEPALLVPRSAAGAGGLQPSQPAMVLHHLVKNSVRYMRRLLVVFIDCSFAFESVSKNPLLNKAPWIQLRHCVIDFQAEVVL